MKVAFCALTFVEGCGAEPREENFALHNSAEQHSKPEQFSAAQSLKTRGYTTYATRVSVYRSRLRILHRTPSNMKVSAYSACLRILHICCLQDPHTGQRLYPAPVGGYCPHPCITWLPLERRTAAPPPDRRSALGSTAAREEDTAAPPRPTRGWQHCRLRRGRPHRRPTGGRQHCHSRGGRLHRRPTGGWPHRHLTGGRPHHHPTGGWPSPKKHACIDASTN